MTGLAGALRSLGQGVPYWTIPFLDEDVYDLAGLEEINRYLGDGPGVGGLPRDRATFRAATPSVENLKNPG